MEAWKARLIVEHRELKERIKKLELFLNSHSTAEIQGYDLMLCQLSVMQAYEYVLFERMKLYGMVTKST